MRIERLQIEDFRLFARTELELDPGWNVLVGGNGAGKTSVLEALHVLAYGRSFRGAVRDGLIRRGQSSLRVFAELVDASGQRRRLGVERGAKGWQGRIDGESAATLADLYRHIAAICFEPGSHALIAGSSEHRRRYLDWALFHVELDFLPTWRRYHRALKQRNVLLKAPELDGDALEAWEREMAEAGESLTLQRETYLERLVPIVRAVAGQFLPELGEATLRYQRGWSREYPGLLEALRATRHRDAVLGYGSAGPHRADWSLAYETLPNRESFSRGQEKLTSLACVLAQARCFELDRGHWPILCLDDLASELDRPHLMKTLDWLDATPAQILLTGTDVPPSAAQVRRTSATFHVEQGIFTRLL